MWTAPSQAVWWISSAKPCPMSQLNSSAPGVDVFPEDPDFPHQLGMIRFPTDPNGNFQAKLFDRTTYKLYAVKYETSGKVTSAEPVTIIPGQLKEGTTIRLVLSHEGDLMTPETNKR
jgi:hypothetical protein